MLALLTRAEEEGYQTGYKAALDSLNVQPVSEEQAEDDGTPRHNITNWVVQSYLEAMPKEGYDLNSISRVRAFTRFVQESTKRRSWTEEMNPYFIYGKGDSLVLSCEGLEPRTITPSGGVFTCYLLYPDKTYNWTMKKSGAVIDSGSFKTTGNVRMIGFDNWTNVRDIGYSGIIKYGLVYSGANPDELIVDSADHEIIRYLCITTQLNMRTYKAGSTQDKAWRPDIFERGANINIENYSPLITAGKNSNFKKAFEYIVTELEAGHKLVFNCWAGADRTGTMRYAIQALCGLPAYLCQAFYEMTSFSRWLNTKIWDKEEGSDGEMRTMIGKLTKLYGSDAYTQFYRLFTEKLGITDAWIKRLQKQLMVDPSKAPVL